MKENMYRKMYSLLLDYELKISNLSKYIKNQKKGKVSKKMVNEMNKLKLHRKYLKMSIKRLKATSDKKWIKAKDEFKTAFRVAKNSLKAMESTMAKAQ